MAESENVFNGDLPPLDPMEAIEEHHSAKTPPPMFDPVEQLASDRAQAAASGLDQSPWSEMEAVLKAKAEAVEHNQNSSRDPSFGDPEAIREVKEFLNLLNQARDMHTKQIMEVMEDDDRDHMTVLIEVRGAVRLLKALTRSVEERLRDLTE